MFGNELTHTYTMHYRMSPRTIGLLIVSLFFLLPLTAQVKGNPEDTLISDADDYLELRGRILESRGEQKDELKQSLDSAEITVTNQGNQVCLFGFTDDKGRLAFRLPLQRSFTISVTKKGYVQKMIRVETFVPKEDRKVFTFTFNVDIFERIEKLDVSVLDRPISRVRYRPLTKTFDYDKEYTAKVNSDLQKMYREYYSLVRAQERQQAAARRDSLKTAAKPAADSTAVSPPHKSTTPRSSGSPASEKPRNSAALYRREIGWIA